MGAGGTSRSGIRLALIRVLPLGLALFVQLTWFKSLASAPDPTAAVRRDWTAFYETGHRLVAGELGSIYPRSFDAGYLWLYPPYCIYLTAPLGFLPEPAAYALCFVIQLVAVLAALRLLRTSLPAAGTAYWAARAVVFASMPFNTTLAMGQITGVLTFILAGVLHLWVRRRTVAAGLLAGLLFIKPHVAVFVLGVAVLAGEWAMVTGTIVCFLALVAGSLPLGVARWTEYLTTTRHYVDVVREVTPAWKQLTLYAFWQTVPGLSPAMANWMWIATGTGLAVIAGRATRRRPDEPARLLGLAVLVAIATNLYAYFYDGLMLALPGVVWYVGRDRYRPLARLGIAACVAAFFVVGYVRVFFVSAGISWAGGLIAAWALFEAWDLALPRAQPAAASASRDGDPAGESRGARPPAR